MSDASHLEKGFAIARGPTMKSYAIGFLLAVFLTLIPFGMVAEGQFSRPLTLSVIAFTAALQILVHLHYFLGLGKSPDTRDNVLSMALAAILIVLMIGGSIWVMSDLHHRMM